MKTRDTDDDGDDDDDEESVPPWKGHTEEAAGEFAAV
jgi:hypothetical protein